MHKYKTYKLKHRNGKEDLISACCKCGSIESRGGIKEDVCSGKMHSNSNVKALNMELVEDQESTE